MDIKLELDLARNLYGPLDDEGRDTLIALTLNPTLESWTVAAGLVVGADGRMTLLQAVCTLDREWLRHMPQSVYDGNQFVYRGWSRVPSAELIVRALRFATH